MGRAANTEDGVWLLMGLARDPRFWQGGWIVDIQTGAAAMTLDRDVLFATASRSARSRTSWCTSPSTRWPGPPTS